MPNTFFELLVQNDIAQIEALLKKNPNAVDKTEKCYGRNLIMEAIILSNYDVVKLLVENGAQLNYQDSNGYTALHHVAQEHQPQIAELLLKSGAKTELQDNHGNTPLATAIVNYRSEGTIIEILLAHGANIHAENKYGISPYKLAKKLGHAGLADYFKEEESDS